MRRVVEELVNMKVTNSLSPNTTGVWAEDRGLRKELRILYNVFEAPPQKILSLRKEDSLLKTGHPKGQRKTLNAP